MLTTSSSVLLAQAMFLFAHAATLTHTVLWNSPWPSYCNQSVVDPQPDFAKFGVTANANNCVQEAFGVSVVF